jgi:hypothetical protein
MEGFEKPMVRRLEEKKSIATKRDKKKPFSFYIFFLRKPPICAECNRILNVGPITSLDRKLRVDIASKTFFDSIEQEIDLLTD